MNTYAYVQANPNTYVDPTGELLVAPLIPVIIKACEVTAAALAGLIAAGAIVEIVDCDDGCSEGSNDSECDEKFSECLGTSLNDMVGGNFGHNRCMLCRDTCEQNGGSWPFRSHTGDRCDYWNSR